METSPSELHARTELTTIKLAAQLIERGRGSRERVAMRAGDRCGGRPTLRVPGALRDRAAAARGHAQGGRPAAALSPASARELMLRSWARYGGQCRAPHPGTAGSAPSGRR
jgi:hypothetical protein